MHDPCLKSRAGCPSHRLLRLAVRMSGQQEAYGNSSAWSRVSDEPEGTGRAVFRRTQKAKCEVLRRTQKAKCEVHHNGCVHHPARMPACQCIAQVLQERHDTGAKTRLLKVREKISMTHFLSQVDGPLLMTVL